MGDRAVVVFKDADGFSPGIYIHWSGGDEGVNDLLRKALPRLRREVASYSAARFCGICHGELPGNLGLGLWDSPINEDFAENFKSYADDDNGLYLVDVQGEQLYVGHYEDGKFQGGWLIEGNTPE